MVQENITPDIRRKRIFLIIERIERINEMIEMHQQHDDDDFMVRQYVYLKSRLLTELQELLEEMIHIKAELKLAA